MGVTSRLLQVALQMAVLALSPSVTAGTLAGVVGGRVRVSTSVRLAAESVEGLVDTALRGHTVFVYSSLDERDLDFLATALRQKTSSLSVFNRREWDQLFWAPIIENGGFRPKTNNLVIFGVTDFMYMRQLICQVHIFIISVCFESLDTILHASKII
ncbi:uncharacterized protein [Penaeus vannamei]|uniref:uncharacterized protein n=1 Tax=Penaeus vannamei TaxID=6689 RepID=UPI00387F9B22